MVRMHLHQMMNSKMGVIYLYYGFMRSSDYTYLWSSKESQESLYDNNGRIMNIDVLNLRLKQFNCRYATLDYIMIIFL